MESSMLLKVVVVLIILTFFINDAVASADGKLSYNIC